MGAERQVTVTLEADLEAFVRNEVDRGDFSSDNDYIVELVRERYDLDRLLKGASLDQALREGISDVEHGRVFPADDAFRILREELGLSKGN